MDCVAGEAGAGVDQGAGRREEGRDFARDELVADG